MAIKFKSFSSGSCGNCYFLGICNEDSGRIEAGILIDAGVSPRRVRMEMEKEGLAADDFSSILISHDHWDHIRSIGSYCKRMPRPVYTSPTLRKALIRRPGTGEYIGGVISDLEEGWNEIVPGRIRVRRFTVPHDATETIGFAIMADSHKYVHITDCGRMTSEAMDWCRQADTVVIESNYDCRMLAEGPYPPDLQARIKGGYGHMSNDECAAAVTQFAHKGLRQVFLCHLSEHNNTPELALRATTRALADIPDISPRVIALPRETASPLFTL
ncbi:MAG: MBL fold metallo-hydrolase [Bacteroidales bacterium]|nr:MBL fold metallo-hydrolase [Bacteroidales bacterium]